MRCHSTWLVAMAICWLGCEANRSDPDPPATPGAPVLAEPAQSREHAAPPSAPVVSGSLWTNVRSKGLAAGDARRFLARADPCVKAAFARHASRRSADIVVERQGGTLRASAGADEKPFTQRIRACFEAIPEETQPQGEWTAEATLVNPG
jgi:hypothetical protein